jgi:hypothetical protein
MPEVQDGGQGGSTSRDSIDDGLIGFFEGHAHQVLQRDDVGGWIDRQELQDRILAQAAGDGADRDGAGDFARAMPAHTVGHDVQPEFGQSLQPGGVPLQDEQRVLVVRPLDAGRLRHAHHNPSLKGVIIACATVVGSSGAVLTPSGVEAGFFLPKMRLNRSMSVLERALGRQVSKA